MGVGNNTSLETLSKLAQNNNVEKEGHFWEAIKSGSHMQKSNIDLWEVCTVDLQEIQLLATCRNCVVGTKKTIIVVKAGTSSLTMGPPQIQILSQLSWSTTNNQTNKADSKKPNELERNPNKSNVNRKAIRVSKTSTLEVIKRPIVVAQSKSEMNAQTLGFIRGR